MHKSVHKKTVLKMVKKVSLLMCGPFALPNLFPNLCLTHIEVYTFFMIFKNFYRFRPCECLRESMREHAFAGRNTLQKE